MLRNSPGKKQSPFLLRSNYRNSNFYSWSLFTNLEFPGGYDLATLRNFQPNTTSFSLLSKWKKGKKGQRWYPYTQNVLNCKALTACPCIKASLHWTSLVLLYPKLKCAGELHYDETIRQKYCQKHSQGVFALPHTWSSSFSWWFSSSSSFCLFKRLAFSLLRTSISSFSFQSDLVCAKLVSGTEAEACIFSLLKIN